VGRTLEDPSLGYNLGGAACTLGLRQDQLELAAEEEDRHIRLGVEVLHTAVPGEVDLVVRPMDLLACHSSTTQMSPPCLLHEKEDERRKATEGNEHKASEVVAGHRPVVHTVVEAVDHIGLAVVAAPTDPVAAVDKVVVVVMLVHMAVVSAVGHTVVAVGLDKKTVDMVKTFGLGVEERVCCNRVGENKVMMLRVWFGLEKKAIEVVLESQDARASGARPADLDMG
jgi:hypothetical protein